MELSFHCKTLWFFEAGWHLCIYFLRTPRPATRVSGRGPKCPPGSVPENGGCPRECPTGCLWGPLRAPSSGVSKKVSRECPGHLFDTLGTLSGHFLDTPETPSGGTLPRTRPFSATLSGTLPGTLRARRAPETPVAGRGVRNLIPNLRMDGRTRNMHETSPTNVKPSSAAAERIFRGFLFLGRRIFSRIFSPDFSSSFLWGKSTQKNPPGKSPEKSSKIYTTKILQHISADWPGQQNFSLAPSKGFHRKFSERMSETPTTTTSQKSIAIHLPFVSQCSWCP